MYDLILIGHTTGYLAETLEARQSYETKSERDKAYRNYKARIKRNPLRVKRAEVIYEFVRKVEV